MITRDAFGRLASGLCPDCDAELRTVEISPRVTVAQIMHDDTCPWLAHQNRTTKENNR